MKTGFAGRTNELAVLQTRLRRVDATGRGVAVALRGRRQVGKSRLVQEFCDASGSPYVYFTATKGMPVTDSLAAFMAELHRSRLPTDPGLLPATVAGWPDAFRALAAAIGDQRVVVVIDELPWLAEQDPVFDGALQTAWDRLLRDRQVLLLLLGSDLHMMERLTAYDRPFFGRADAMVLNPLNPGEVAAALDLPAAEGIDAHLITGGLPGVLQSWPTGMAPQDFVYQECADPPAPLFGVPEAALLAEFPAPDTSRRILEAVGSGERTHANIAATAGSGGAIASGTLSPLLQRLTVEKRVLAADQPLSTQPGKPTLYRVADTNLRLYLAMLRMMHELVKRGRPSAARELFTRRWTAWRGKAVEPLVREALELAGLAGELPWEGVGVVGGWWNRAFNPEIDIVGADRGPVAGAVRFAGSIKWLAEPFGTRDLAALRGGVDSVPGYVPGETGLLAVSLSGFGAGAAESGLCCWGPEEILAVWA